MRDLICLSLRFASFQRRCATRGPPRKARPPTPMTRVCASDYVVCLTLGFSSRPPRCVSRPEPRAQGSSAWVAALCLAGGASPPTSDRRLGAPCVSARQSGANGAPALRSRRRCAFAPDGLARRIRTRLPPILRRGLRRSGLDAPPPASPVPQRHSPAAHQHSVRKRTSQDWRHKNAARRRLSSDAENPHRFLLVA